MGLTWKSIDVLKKRTKIEWHVLFPFLGIKPKLTAYNSHKKIGQTLTDRIIELAKFYAHGLEVFVTVDDFNNWLSKPSVDLSRQRPVDIMFSTHGLNEIRRVLDKVECGIPV
ncbi:MAG: DUF2384 domain-containing protein [Cyclobacteriaceae bacterium]|nr:DUF2384 domain-containing protein [Cyclobacteriaceae bacterium]